MLESPATRWRLPQAELVTASVALLFVCSAIFFAGGWDSGAPPAVTGASEPVAAGGDGPVAVPPAGPDSTTGEPPRALAESVDVGETLARIDADGLYKALFLLVGPVQGQPATGPEPKAPPAPSPTAAPGAASSSGCPQAATAGFALVLFDALNSERTQRGLSALAADACLAYIGQLHSDDMAQRGYFSHVSPEGVTAFALLRRYGVGYASAGENLARNDYPVQETVAVAVRDLMASPAHRANILDPYYTRMGVAAADDGAGMKYYTMLYVDAS